MARPAVAAFARLAEGSAKPTRELAGQNTLFVRTMHDMAYDPARDEIVVPQFYAYAILTFRGDANGDVAPIRKIFGPSTRLKNPEALAVDYVHGEIFVPESDKILVFRRDTDGDAAPIRVLEGPNAGLRLGRVAVDGVNNVLIAGSRDSLRIFDRTASGNAKPRAVIAGPKARLSGNLLMTTYPPKEWVISAVNSGDRHDLGDYIGVWSIHDSGDVPARWTIGNGLFKDIRGIAIDPKSKTVIATDKTLNAIVTFHVPEIF